MLTTWVPYGTFCWAQCASFQAPIWMTSDSMSVKMNSSSLSCPCFPLFFLHWQLHGGETTHCVAQLRAGRGLLGRSAMEGVFIYTAVLCGCSKLHVGEPCAGGGTVPGKGMRRNQYQPSLQTQCRSKARFYWHCEAQQIHQRKEMIQFNSGVLGHSNSNILGSKLRSLPSGWLRCAES